MTCSCLGSYNYTIVFELKFPELPENNVIILLMSYPAAASSQLSLSCILSPVPNNSTTFRSTALSYNNGYNLSSGTLRFAIKIISDIESKQTIINAPNALVRDLGSLLDSEQHSDFTVKVENTIFKVHKGILASRSNTLAKMIEADMIEKKNSQIVLKNWDSMVVKELLHFIYTGSCELSKVPHELFKLSHFLELGDLASLCEMYLTKNINIKNIINILELSDQEQYGLSELKSAAMKFVELHEKILATDIEFQEYLGTNIRLNNIVFILRIAHKYSLQDVMTQAMEFVKRNYKEILAMPDCKTFLLSKSELMLQILRFCCDSYTTQLDLVKANNE